MVEERGLYNNNNVININNDYEDSNKYERHILFIGDGVNDAQAISVATIGVAIDTKNVLTCESADIVILGSDLRNVV